MPRAEIVFRTRRREVTVGADPRVVGVLCSLARRLPVRAKKMACDVVEVRLDKTGRPRDWLERCRGIETAGWPVLLTVRLRAEGGDWGEADEDRRPIFEAGLERLAGVDVELRSELARRVARRAKGLGKVCVVSYHDFQKTPAVAELESVIAEAQEFASIVKIATRLSCESDAAILRSLLARQWKRPLCVIGMGPAWGETRVTFPRLGSCLAYGYLDKATAPGQTSAAALTRQLRGKR